MATNVPRRSLHLPRPIFTLPPSIRQSLLLRSQPLETSRTRPASTSTSTSTSAPSPTLVPPPTETTGPLLQRLPNRALPTLATRSSSTLYRTLPLFLLICTLSSLAIFNYQKSSSSTVASILYSLRTNASVRAILGDEIYFASRIPWISGELNPMQGRIDISFWVKGTKGQGKVKFVSVRGKGKRYFETTEWSLKMDDGREVMLLDGMGVEDVMTGVDERLQAVN